MRAASSAKHLIANLFIRTEGQLVFAWDLAGVSLEDQSSCHKLSLGDKGLPF